MRIFNYKFLIFNQVKSLRQRRVGFTLIELLVTIAIIATLATVLMIVVNPNEMAKRSRDTKRISDLGTLKSSIDLALADGETLSTTGWITLSNSTSIINIDGAGLDLSKYLSVVPQDPGGTSVHVKNDANCNNATNETDSAAKAFQFKSDSVSNTYVLRGQLESTLPSNCEKVKNDGNSDVYYELGTDPGLDL